MSRRDDPDAVLDAQLGELLRDAVSGVDPDDRLGELRARTSQPPRRRGALVAVVGAALAGAAVVVAVAVVGPDTLVPDGSRPAVPPANSPSTDRPSTAGSATPEPTRTPMPSRAVAGYYLGDTPGGVRLFREFRDVPTVDEDPRAALGLLTRAPADPDYRTLWPEDAFAGAAVGDDRITVELADASLTERPAAMSDEEAGASVQQVVYTMQAHAQQRLPVEFTTAAGPVGEVLGTTTDGPVPATAPAQALSLVSLSDPEEGQPVSGRFRVDGSANAFEANVLWMLTDASGREVDSSFFTADGFDGERLFPFSGTVDVSGLAPGRYQLSVQTEDASGGTEGSGPHVDTRTVVVD